MSKAIFHATKKSRGFTLIEVLIVVAIIGILASVIYPSYNDFVLSSNRTEAQRELLRLANLQEQLFVDQRAYTADMTDLGADADPYLVPNYSIDGVVNARTFTLTATAVGKQLSDINCLTLTINEVGLKTPVANCWE